MALSLVTCLGSNCSFRYPNIAEFVIEKRHADSEINRATVRLNGSQNSYCVKRESEDCADLSFGQDISLVTPRMECATAMISWSGCSKDAFR